MPRFPVAAVLLVLVSLGLLTVAWLGSDEEEGTAAQGEATAGDGSGVPLSIPEYSAAAEAGIETGAVILMYHRFGRDEFASTSVRMEQFEDHLEYLEEAEFNIWPLERVVRYLQEGRTFPDRTVAITIDDAYPTVYENAFPEFRERGWPYTVFVSTDGPDGGGQSYMNWDQLREMAEESEARFANHSATHDYLVQRREGESEADWEERVRADIGKAEERLHEELAGHVADDPPLHAYPYGEYDAELRRIVDDMGYVALGQHSGPVGAHSDHLALPRFAMAENYADPNDFRLRVHTRPMPLKGMEPNDPVHIDEENPPRMVLTLEEGAVDIGRMNCFAGPRDVVLERDPGPPPRVSVQATEPLPQGRSRYNCTLPAAGGGFHWYSFQWIKGRR